MSDEQNARERIFNLLRPYASNWSGTLGRGDLVIPHREIPRLVHAILAAVNDPTDQAAEASETDLFQVLREAQRLPSLQDQVQRLQAAFLILTR